MKLEQRRMFLVCGFNEPREVDVIYKDGNAFVISIAGDNDFCQADDDDILFETKEEADKYHSKITHKFNAEEIKEYIDSFGMYSDKLKEVLPDSVYDRYERGLNKVMFLSYKDREILRMALNGILNIGPDSFRISDISSVKYGGDWAYAILKNGEEVIPRTGIEIFILESIFGCNNSDVIYKHIKDPFKIEE